jgi:NADH:ubiquinone reductase (H+-translocating)
MHRVVIVGGGFAGLNAAKRLRGAAADVTLVDRRNFHLFQPLLYQVATAGLSPGDIAFPLRRVLRRQSNARVIVGEMDGLDINRRLLLLKDGEIGYDTLVVATGATHSYFGNPEWARFAQGLKNIEDATEIRGRIYYAFEAAEREADPEKRIAWLTFVVVGAGPTGVELAGALAEIARDTLKDDFRSIRTEESRILLLEASDRVLPVYPPALSHPAELQLLHLGVRTLVGARVTSVDATGLVYERAGIEQHVESHTVLWAAGVKGSAAGAIIARETGTTLDRAGRIPVQPDLSVPGHPEILVLGDLAYIETDGAMVPGNAPAAIQMGQYAARLIRARLESRAIPPFRYFNKGSLATIGRHAAVADFGRVRFSGPIAWLAWLFIHLMYLVGFQNRILVLIQWGFLYFTYNRGARLITGNTAPMSWYSLHAGRSGDSDRK